MSTPHIAPHIASRSRQFTAWLLSWGERPSGPIVLVAMTLLEATVFPAPTEAMLLTLCISRPRRAWTFALLAATGSMVGGVIGYHLGSTVFDAVAQPLISAFGMNAALPAVEAAYRENMWLALTTSGYTPIPYMLYTMMAGAFSLPLGEFAAASFIGRALKFAPIAVLAIVLGGRVRNILQRYAGWAGVIITGIVIAAVVWGVW